MKKEKPIIKHMVTVKRKGKCAEFAVKIAGPFQGYKNGGNLTINN